MSQLTLKGFKKHKKIVIQKEFGTQAEQLKSSVFWVFVERFQAKLNLKMALRVPAMG